MSAMVLRRSAVVIAVLAAAFTFGTAHAGAVTIGADLTRTPNVGYGCEVTPGTGAFGQRFFLPTGVANCTYLATSADLAESPQGLKPGGILTSVSVRAGPTTGPMQATILRATRSFLGFQCCYYAGASQTFTPAPNTVTRVPVRLPMRNEFDTPNATETVDYLGLSVLAPGVPIPMVDLGGGMLPGAIAFHPFVAPEDVRVNGAGLGGLVPLIAGDFQPTCGASAASSRGSSVRGTRVRSSATRCLAALTLARNRARLRSNRARLPLRCNSPAACVGKVRLQTRRGRGTTLASARVKIAAAGTRTLKPRLTKRGKRLMARKRSRKLWLNAIVTDGSGAKGRVSTRVTLRR